MARTSGVEYVSPYAGPALMARQTSSLAAEPTATHLLETEHGFIETAKQVEVTHKHHRDTHHENKNHHKYEDWSKLVNGIFSAANVDKTNPHSSSKELHEACKQIAKDLASRKMNHGGLTDPKQKELFEKYLVDMLLRIHEPRVLGTLIAMRSLSAQSPMWGKLGHIQKSTFKKNEGAEYYIFKVPYGQGKETIETIGKQAFVAMKEDRFIVKDVKDLDKTLQSLSEMMSANNFQQLTPEQHKLLYRSRGGRQRKNKKNKGKGKGKHGAMKHGHSNHHVHRISKLERELAFHRGKEAGRRASHALSEHGSRPGSRGSQHSRSRAGSHRSRHGLFDNGPDEYEYDYDYGEPTNVDDNHFYKRHAQPKPRATSVDRSDRSLFAPRGH